MTWATLTGSKGAAGSIMNWVSYSKLDVETVVDEAQSLIFSMLRIREMRTTWTLGMGVGQSSIALPARFLDPIGRLYDTTNGGHLSHKIETDILDLRTYTPVSGAFGVNPFTTQFPTGATNFQVFSALTGHPFTQGSTITIAGATSPIDGVDVNGTFPVTQRLSANTFRFGVDTLATIGGIPGGGSNATYTGNVLVDGYPSRWSIFDEQLNFDLAFDTATAFRLLYFRSPLLLSATNQSNWLTNRYPMLMRKACQAAAADFMKDDIEYKKGVAGLTALIQSTAAESDFTYRGAEFGTDTP